jgi:hypothetical protein
MTPPDLVKYPGLTGHWTLIKEAPDGLRFPLRPSGATSWIQQIQYNLDQRDADKRTRTFTSCETRT